MPTSYRAACIARYVCLALPTLLLLGGCPSSTNDLGQGAQAEPPAAAEAAGIGESGGEQASTLMPVAQADAREVFRPATINDFLAAIGPERIIELDPAVLYRIDESTRGVSDYYYWKDEVFNEFELVIRDCPDLTIRSGGAEKTHVVTRFGYTYVLSFENCDGLALEGLRLGHHPDPGYCAGGVVRIANSRNTRIDNSLLYGCGTEGLHLNKARGFTFNASVVESCTGGIMSVEDSRNLTFIGSVFRDNETYYGFKFLNTIGIGFEDCEVTGNVGEYRHMMVALFETNLDIPERLITFKGGRIANNRMGALEAPASILQTADTVLEGNMFVPPSNE